MGFYLDVKFIQKKRWWFDICKTDYNTVKNNYIMLGLE